jgi:hypothetical protein
MSAEGASSAPVLAPFPPGTQLPLPGSLSARLQSAFLTVGAPLLPHKPTLLLARDAGDRTFVLKVGEMDALLNEFQLQTLAYGLGVRTCLPVGLLHVGHAAVLVLPFVPSLCALADYDGVETTILPARQPEVTAMLDVLYDAGIVYNDRTGYNFLVHEPTQELYLLDFEHAELAPQPIPASDRAYSYNPDFF